MKEDCETHKYPIQRLRVMCCRQLTGILHMALQIPKLLQPYFADIHDIIALRYGRLKMWAL